MKYLKKYNEEFNFKFIDKLKIKNSCRKYGIRNFKINDDLSIDVDDDVNLSVHPYSQHIRELTEIPLKFRNVNGSFNCSNNLLTSLEGCPKSVGRYFSCTSNKLTSLEGCPEYVDGDFNCSSNELTSLVGAPKSVGEDFFCSFNKIKTLDGFPIYCENIYFHEVDERIPRRYVKHPREGDNPVRELWKLFEDVEKVELFNDFGITDGEVVILDRLNEFLEMIGSPNSGFALTDYAIKIRGHHLISNLEKVGYKCI